MQRDTDSLIRRIYDAVDDIRLTNKQREVIMSATIVTRWSSPSIAAAMDVTKRAKAVWMKHGAQDFRVNQVYTGEFTGQVIVAIVFPDMAGYASSQAKAAAEMQPLFEETARLGNVLQERTILLSVDV